MSDLASQCGALRDGMGYCDLSGRTQIELTGEDRSKVLHGLCTNDINRLTSGDGSEAFLTNVQGKTTGYVNVFCREASLVIDTAPGLAGEIIPALDRYVIREDVKLVDRTNDWAEVLVSGSQASGLLASHFVGSMPDSRIGISDGTIAHVQVQLRCLPYTSPECFFLCCDLSHRSSIVAWLRQTDAIECDQEAVNVARIEMGIPIYGQDVTVDNLPQELARDELAISFTKGCYLGQETVARIDALGHVNRRLLGLKFSGETVPPPGTGIAVDGKQVAEITSSCFSPRLEAPLALAFVRQGSSKPGTILQCPLGEAEVVDLPMR
ncbi:MAG: tRNA-modifying protein YgfZ [Planctomycetes bacterium]|nr:tRNA-modifying protein YgfZ [Planctomycetota bacterium]